MLCELFAHLKSFFLNMQKWNTFFYVSVLSHAAVWYRWGWENHTRGVYFSAALSTGCVRSKHGQALQGDWCWQLWFHHLQWVDSGLIQKSNAKIQFDHLSFFCISTGILWNRKMFYHYYVGFPYPKLLCLWFFRWISSLCHDPPGVRKALHHIPGASEIPSYPAGDARWSGIGLSDQFRGKAGR